MTLTKPGLTTSFGKRNYSLGTLAKDMYYRGYDFSHFLAMSIPVLMIESIVRIGYFVKRLSEGHDISESIPFNAPGFPIRPKLQTMLFTAHTIATTVNISKTLITQNPLAINYPQCLIFMKYLFSQLNWVLFKKEELFSEFFDKKSSDDWEVMHNELKTLWAKAIMI